MAECSGAGQERLQVRRGISMDTFLSFYVLPALLILLKSVV